MTPGRIFALGGAEFDMRPHNVALHAYIVEQIDRPEPRICLLPTASGDPGHQIASFHSAFEARGASTSHISLFRLGERPVRLREHLLGQDAIYVGGGSLVNLIALWRAHRVDETLREALDAGVFIAGHSAGAMCWYEGGITRSHGGPSAAPGLGVLEGTASAHDDSDPERAMAFRAAIAAGFGDGIALDDHVGALYVQGELAEVVSGRPGAGARWISEGGGSLTEDRLAVRELSVPRRWQHDEDIAEYRRVAALRSHATPGGLPGSRVARPR
jgi:peptidase E